MKLKHFYTAIIFLISLQLYAEKFDYDGMRYRGETVKEYAISEKGTLLMKEIHGDIKIIGEARNNILVTERYSINAYSESSAEKIYQEYRAKYILKGNTLIVEGQEDSKRYHSDFLVQVPANFNLDINASGGDLVAEKISGTVEMHTSGGDIDILEIQGNLNINTSGGDINIRKSGEDINAGTSGGDVVCDGIVGKLYAKTSGGDITVEDLQGDGEIRTSGGDIYISHIKGKRFDGSTSGGDIGADYIDADLKLNTSGGDIVIGKTASHVRLHTSGGDIDVEEVGGNLDASTSGGDITVEKVKGTCTVNTSGGDIDLGLAMDNVRATTSGGDIYMSNVYGAVFAHTSGGDIELHKELHKSSKDNTIDLGSSGGDIYLSIPDNIKADIFAQIIVYNKWDKNEIRSDFPLDITQEQRGSKLIITGKGSVNGGGDDITLKTSGGDIKISRLMQ